MRVPGHPVLVLLLCLACLLLGVAAGRLLPPAWVGGGGELWEARGEAGSSGRAQGERGAPTLPAGPAPALPDFAGLIENVREGVVQILMERAVEPEAGLGEGVLEGLGTVGDPENPPPPTPSNALVQATGFLLNAEKGLVVTNHHAIRGSRSIVVRLAGHRQAVADVVAWDELSDIALLRLRFTWNDLKALPLGDSERVRPGEWVLVLGNPFDYALTAQHGIVSHVGRHLRSGDRGDDALPFSNPYIQFTAPVYPGNSGGPLFDMDGAVVGVISRAAPAAQGISFAVPSHILKKVLEQFRSEGRSDRGWIGMEFRPEDPQEAGLPPGQAQAVVEAVRVGGTLTGSPAHRAGLRAGDLVVAFNGEPVRGAQDLYERITDSRPGTQVSLEIRRPLRPGSRSLRPMTLEVPVLSGRAASSGLDRLD